MATFSDQGRNTENGENKSGLNFLQGFSKDKVEEMMRNRKLFRNFIPCR